MSPPCCCYCYVGWTSPPTLAPRPWKIMAQTFNYISTWAIGMSSGSTSPPTILPSANCTHPLTTPAYAQAAGCVFQATLALIVFGASRDRCLFITGCAVARTPLYLKCTLFCAFIHSLVNGIPLRFNGAFRPLTYHCLRVACLYVPVWTRKNTRYSDLLADRQNLQGRYVARWSGVGGWCLLHLILLTSVWRSQATSNPLLWPNLFWGC